MDKAAHCLRGSCFYALYGVKPFLFTRVFCMLGTNGYCSVSVCRYGGLSGTDVKKEKKVLLFVFKEVQNNIKKN